MVDSGRIRTIKKGSFSGDCVLYWMIRDKRVDDNWALITAQDIALKNGVPLIVCFQYIGKFSKANIRQYSFLFKGLEELRIKLEELNIEFLLLQEKAHEVLPKIIKKKISRQSHC